MRARCAPTSLAISRASSSPSSGGLENVRGGGVVDQVWSCDWPPLPREPRGRWPARQRPSRGSRPSRTGSGDLRGRPPCGRPRRRARFRRSASGRLEDDAGGDAGSDAEVAQIGAIAALVDPRRCRARVVLDEAGEAGLRGSRSGRGPCPAHPGLPRARRCRCAAPPVPGWPRRSAATRRPSRSPTASVAPRARLTIWSVSRARSVGSTWWWTIRSAESVTTQAILVPPTSMPIVRNSASPDAGAVRGRKVGSAMTAVPTIIGRGSVRGSSSEAQSELVGHEKRRRAEHHDVVVAGAELDPHAGGQQWQSGVQRPSAGWRRATRHPMPLPVRRGGRDLRSPWRPWPRSPFRASRRRRRRPVGRCDRRREARRRAWRRP